MTARQPGAERGDGPVRVVAGAVKPSVHDPLDQVRDDLLLAAVRHSLEPAQLSAWIAGGDR